MTIEDTLQEPVATWEKEDGVVYDEYRLADGSCVFRLRNARFPAIGMLVIHPIGGDKHSLARVLDESGNSAAQREKAEILDKHFDICARLLRFFPNMDVDGFEDSPPTEEERDTILKAIELTKAELKN